MCYFIFYIYGNDVREDVVASKISAKTAYPTGRYEIDLHDATYFIFILFYFLYLWQWYEGGRGGEQVSAKTVNPTE
jgi:hypothetical protein